MKLGKLGVWTFFDAVTAATSLQIAKRVEHLGYSAQWVREARGRNVLVHAAWLLAGTDKLVVASGIANIYARDAMAMARAQRGLNEQSNGRFLLGIGVSHRPMVNTLRGHVYAKPVATMRAYLEAMRAAPYLAPPPPEPPCTVLAVLGPRMLALAAELVDGARIHIMSRRSILPMRDASLAFDAKCADICEVYKAAPGADDSHRTISIDERPAFRPWSASRRICR